MKLRDALAELDRKYMYADDATNEVELAEALVGKSIREERRNKKISLRGFATKLGISPAYLSDIERGNRFPAFDVLEKIKSNLKHG